MAITKGEDGTIGVTGSDVAVVGNIIRAHGWRNAAHMKVNFGMSSKAYPSVSAFNLEYGVKAKTWAQILKVMNDALGRDK